jgi:amino acid adenylation domain-containing protein
MRHPVSPPASPAQEQLWFIDEFHRGLPAHNVPNLIRLRGKLDVAALSRALAAVAARHEPLRTRLAAAGDGHPVLLIDPPGGPGQPDLAGGLTDYAGLPPDAAAQELAGLADREALRPFHLGDDHPLRARLIRMTAAEHALVLVAHQTAVDDRSLGVLVADLAALYRAEVTGEPAGLPVLPARFADVAAAQREFLAGPEAAGLADYWRTALAGYETSRFPADRLRPRLADHNGAVADILAGPEVLRGLQELSRAEGTTLPVTLLAAVLALLHRYTGQADLIAGMASGPGHAGQLRPELAGMVGYLADTLPVRADASGDPALAGFLARVHTAVAGAVAHQDLPFARLVDILGIERDPGRFPVFQTAVSYAEPGRDAEAAGVTFHLERVPLRAARYDISFRAEPRPDGLWLEATYTPALFDAATVRRLLGNLGVLLGGMAADPSARLSELPVLTQAELRAELEEWNDTAADLPVQCIHEGFEEQVAAAPQAAAAEYEGERLSYHALNRQANQIARWLAGLGAGPETPVGVCMQTSLHRLATLLGIWKAGAGYLPLDPAAPADRLAFMIADAGLRVLVTDAASRGRVPDAAGVTVVCLDDAWSQLRDLPGDNLSGTGVTPANVAYVIYTSGSTGQPKGVVVEHRQAITFLHGMARHWRIGPGSAVLGFAAYTFDVSVMDMFMPLLGGAKVVLAAGPTLHSPPRLAELMRGAGITFACLPPAVLGLLTGEEFPQLRTLLSAGEELSSELLRAWLRDGLEIYNGYGPTEASIGSTFMKLEPGTPLPPPIGRPKPNYQAYVLDARLNPVPVGVTGELHIGGAGVARGYLNRPELTAERFIGDPFRPGGRLYKTGDLARRRPDGTLVFAGRIDGQVKIRGLRVELGEIEAALAAHPAVAQAVVAVVAGPAGGQQLAAYLRIRPGAGPPGDHGNGCGLPGSLDKDVRSHLARVLPPAEIPDYLVAVSEFPLSNSGKIDRAALPAPASPRTASGGDAAPATLLEIMLCDIYAGVLGSDLIAATDSFFELGGTSLAAMRLVGELSSELEIDVGVSAVFLAPAPRQLAAMLCDEHGLRDEALQDIDPGDLGAPGSAESYGARAAPRP